MAFSTDELHLEVAELHDKVDALQATLDQILAQVANGAAQIGPLLNSPMLKGLAGMFGTK